MQTAEISISVIIPTLNEESMLPGLLETILAERANVEIIVADGGSTDLTRVICNQFGVTLIQSEGGRAGQMNAGAETASGEILFFVHADSRLPSNWTDQIMRLLATDVIAGSFSLDFDDRTALLNFYARLSTVNHSLFTYGDQGLFLYKSTFEKTGGFALIPIMEDVEILKRLRRMGRVVKAGSSIITSSRRFKKNGPLVQQLKNIGLVLAYKAGVSPSWLQKFYPYN